MNNRPTCNTQTLLLPLLALLLSGCGPTVKVEGSEKPITINLNVKIDHEILLKLDRDVETLIEENDEIF